MAANLLFFNYADVFFSNLLGFTLLNTNLRNPTYAADMPERYVAGDS